MPPSQDSDTVLTRGKTDHSGAQTTEIELQRSRVWALKVDSSLTLITLLKDILTISWVFLLGDLQTTCELKFKNPILNNVTYKFLELFYRLKALQKPHYLFIFHILLYIKALVILHIWHSFSIVPAPLWLYCCNRWKL